VFTGTQDEADQQGISIHNGFGSFKLHIDATQTKNDLAYHTYMNEIDEWAVELGYIRGTRRVEKKNPAKEKPAQINTWRPPKRGRSALQWSIQNESVEVQDPAHQGLNKQELLSDLGSQPCSQRYWDWEELRWKSRGVSPGQDQGWTNPSRDLCHKTFFVPNLLIFEIS
jgi:hypothetical protein